MPTINSYYHQSRMGMTRYMSCFNTILRTTKVYIINDLIQHHHHHHYHVFYHPQVNHTTRRNITSTRKFTTSTVTTSNTNNQRYYHIHQNNTNNSYQRCCMPYLPTDTRTASTIPLIMVTRRFQTNTTITDPLPPSFIGNSSNLSGQNQSSIGTVSNEEQKQQQQQNQPPPFMGLPTRHSRKLPPLVITDMVELTEMATEIIETRIGQLYTYNEYALNKVEATKHRTAWEIADVTVQKVEAIIRGLSYLAPNTIWNRWITEQQQQEQHLYQRKGPHPKMSSQSSASNSTITGGTTISDFPPSDILLLQQQLIDRLMDEGHAYMTIRNIRMEDMFGKKGSSSEKVSDNNDNVGGMFDKKGNRIPIETKSDEKSSSTDTLLSSIGKDIEDDEDDDDYDEKAAMERKMNSSYMYDFAPPGPTTAMYDTILDTLACTASQTTDRYDTLEWGQYIHEMIMTRHTNDGNDALNDNPHTRPTQISFNALIRLCAELPYDNSVNISIDNAPIKDVEYRDDVVGTFIGTLQNMHECSIVQRNSASYKYSLDCIGKYMPPSRIRGNITTGLFHHARYACIVNDKVVQSYINANIPSNDEWNDNFIQKELQPTWPVKWKRDSRKLQFHPKDDTY